MRGQLAQLRARLRQLQLADTHKLGAKLQQLITQQQLKGSALAKLEQAISAAEQRLAKRRALLPQPKCAQQLPVNAAGEAIKQLIRDNQVLILCSATGSGKTTQLPQLCLQLGLGVRGMIAHTQPRRLAARSVAARIAAELDSELGDKVGYKVRFDECLGADCFIKLMTDGILLAETAHDKLLRQYDTIIIDEAHERSLNIDFLLGYIKRILPRRPDLKVIITSATIDPEGFAKHFAGAPIKIVEGRSYPVAIEYRPAVDGNSNAEIISCLNEIIKHGAGDVLVFLAGEREIREVHQLIKQQQFSNMQVLALYGRLSNKEQARIFAPSSMRKVVLATNVAETSLTVPGIVYVIDAGSARIARYSYRSKIARLPIEPIAQASAKQRAGRCGRTMAGTCYRLYSEEDLLQRPEFTEPEILRSNLAQVILQMAALNLGSIEQFDFIDRPDSRLINDGYKLLHELGAMRGHGSAKARQYKLTKLGRDMAKLPIDPKLARVLLGAGSYAALSEALTICAFLSIQDPRERPHGSRASADECHSSWQDARSDFCALINLFAHFNKSREDLTSSQLRKWCAANYLNYMRMREWQDTRRQLASLCKALKLNFNKQPASYTQLHQSLLLGFIGNIGQRDEKNYLGPRNRRFLPFPGSGINAKAKWVVAAEIIETSRVYAHHLAVIEAKWLETQAAHLLKYQYSEVHFVAKTGAVCAYAKITLYGLVVNPRQRVNYAPIDPKVAREVFINEALVALKLNSRAEFMRHNQRAVDKLRNLEAKYRRSDLGDDGSRRYQFFAELLPATVVDAASFEKWRRQVEPQNPQILHLPAQLLLAAASAPRAEDYPDFLDFNGLRLELSYRFAPRRADDGVSVLLPVAALKQLPTELPAWLVAGMLPEKLTQLIKTLPKHLRVQVIPAPEYARRALKQMPPRSGCLLTAFAAALSELGGTVISAADFVLEKLDEHLFMRFVVLASDGEVLGAGRDLPALQQRFAEQADAHFYAGELHELERDGITSWDFAKLPDELEFCQNGVALKGYPALVDMQTSVSIRLIGSRAEREHIHSAGLARLFALQLGAEFKYLRRNLSDLDKIALWYAALGDREALLADIMQSLLQQVFLEQEIPRSKAQFTEQLQLGKAKMHAAANELSALLLNIFMLYKDIKKRISKALPLSWIEAVADINTQLDSLIFAGFVSRCAANLPDYPRYLQAIAVRLDKIDYAPDKERLRRAQIEPLAVQLAKFQARADSSYWQAFWALQELRVATFAQNLGAKGKVSIGRVEQQLRELGKAK